MTHNTNNHFNSDVEVSDNEYNSTSSKINDDFEENCDENQKITSKSIEFIPSLALTPSSHRFCPKSLSKSLPRLLAPKAEIENGRYQIEQPAALFVDIWNIISPFAFSQTLQTFIDNKLRMFVVEMFNEKFVKNVQNNLINDNETRKICNPLLPSITKSGSTVEQINSLVDNILFRRKHEPETVYIFQELIDSLLLQGFKTGQLKPSKFEDVIPSFCQWSSKNIRIYTIDNSSETYQRNFLKAADIPDNIFTGYLNSKSEYKYKDFNRFVTEINTLNKSIFYITATFNRAKEAAKAGIMPILVLRDGEQKYSKTQLQKYLVVKVLSEFTFCGSK